MKRFCVINTRAEHQQAELTMLCQQRGWDVLSYPCLALEYTNAIALRNSLSVPVRHYAWLILTSSNAVDAVAATFTGSDVHLPPVACVGLATAQRAEQKLGRVNAFLPESATGSCLAHQLPMQPGDRILLPQSEIARSETLDILQSRGAIVDVIAAYRILEGTGGDNVPLAILAKQVDAVLITSPSALDGFCKRLLDAGVPSELLQQVMFVPIGPTSAKAISDHGLKGLPPPTNPSLNELVEATGLYFDRLGLQNETVQT